MNNNNHSIFHFNIILNKIIDCDSCSHSIITVKVNRWISINKH